MDARRFGPAREIRCGVDERWGRSEGGTGRGGWDRLGWGRSRARKVVREPRGGMMRGIETTLEIGGLGLGRIIQEYLWKEW